MAFNPEDQRKYIKRHAETPKPEVEEPLGRSSSHASCARSKTRSSFGPGPVRLQDTSKPRKRTPANAAAPNEDATSSGWRDR